MYIGVMPELRHETIMSGLRRRFPHRGRSTQLDDAVSGGRCSLQGRTENGRPL